MNHRQNLLVVKRTGWKSATYFIARPSQPTGAAGHPSPLYGKAKGH
jgi:hypothetical protein